MAGPLVTCKCLLQLYGGPARMPVHPTTPWRARSYIISASAIIMAGPLSTCKRLLQPYGGPARMPVRTITP